MITTLIFIHWARRNEIIREKILSGLHAGENVVVDIKPFRLWCNDRNKYVIVTCNDPIDFLSYKMVPMRIGYQELEGIITSTGWPDNPDMDYVFNLRKQGYIFSVKRV